MEDLPAVFMDMNLCQEDESYAILPFVESVRSDVPMELRDRFYFHIHHMLEKFVRSSEGM